MLFRSTVTAGSVDLSGLSVADSGTNPTFEITFVGRNSTAPVVTLTSLSGPPQLCLTMHPQPGCPLVAGQLSDPLPLVSATGSTRMGRELAPVVAARFGRSILELGGNNAAVVAPSADLDLAVRAITFAAAGTAGQRCTSLRRLIVHRSIVDDVADRVTRAFSRLPVGKIGRAHV